MPARLSEQQSSQPDRSTTDNAGWWGPAQRQTAFYALIGLAPAMLLWKLAPFNYTLAAALLLLPSIGARFWRLPGLTWALAFVLTQFLSGLLSQQADGFLEAGTRSSLYTFVSLYLVAVGCPAFIRWRWPLALSLGALGASAILSSLQFVIGWGMHERPWRINSSGLRFELSSGFHSGKHGQGFIMATLALFLTQWPAGHRLLGRIGTGVAVVGTLLANARASIIGLVIGQSSGVLLRHPRLWRRAIAGGIGLALIGMTWIYVATPERFTNMLSFEDGRLAIWRCSLHVIAEHPWLGCGGRTAFQAAYADTFPRVMGEAWNEFPQGAPHAHNWLLILWAEYGLGTVLAFLGLVTSVLRFVWRRRETQPAAWAICMSGIALFLCAGLFEDILGRSLTAHAFWMLLGLGLGLAAQEQIWPQPTTGHDHRGPLSSGASDGGGAVAASG